MDYAQTPHGKLIEQDRAQSQQNHDWCRALGWLFLTTAVLLLPLYVWYHTNVPADSSTALLRLAGVVLLAAILCLSAMLSFQAARLWQRELKFSTLRFDIYHANNEVWHSIFQRHIPDYRNNNTELSVAEELMRAVKLQTERSALFARELEALQRSQNITLAQATDRLVAQSLENRNIRASRRTIEDVYESYEFDRSTLIQFPKQD